ncbi:MAG: hypothetical protein ACI30J_05845, partial [Paludibacteraceae bacterium]
SRQVGINEAGRGSTPASPVDACAPGYCVPGQALLFLCSFLRPCFESFSSRFRDWRLLGAY